MLKCNDSKMILDALYQACLLYEELKTMQNNPDTSRLFRTQSRAPLENIHPYESVLCAAATALLILRKNGDAPLLNDEKIALARFWKLFCTEGLFTSEACEDILHLMGQLEGPKLRQ